MYGDLSYKSIRISCLWENTTEKDGVLKHLEIFDKVLGREIGDNGGGRVIDVIQDKIMVFTVVAIIDALVGGVLSRYRIFQRRKAGQGGDVLRLDNIRKPQRQGCK